MDSWLAGSSPYPVFSPARLRTSPITEAGEGAAVLRGERTALSTAAARARLDLVWEAPCCPKQDHSRLPGFVPMLAK